MKSIWFFKKCARTNVYLLCKQSVQVNDNFSSSKKVHAGVPQGLKDGHLSFNLFINDVYFFY